MAYICTLPDGSNHTLLSDRDHLDLIREYMGDDICNWVSRMIYAATYDDDKLASLEEDYTLTEDLLDECRTTLDQGRSIARTISNLAYEIRNLSNRLKDTLDYDQ